MKKIYFQPPGIDPSFCEVGTLNKKDPDFIHYMYEPCKIPISDVSIIAKELVLFDEKTGLYRVKTHH